MNPINVCAPKGGQGVTTTAVSLTHELGLHGTVFLHSSGISEKEFAIDVTGILGDPIPTDPKFKIANNVYVNPIHEAEFEPDHVVVDYQEMTLLAKVIEPDEITIIVIRPDYLSLRRIMNTDPILGKVGMVIIEEPGRSLDHHDVRSVVPYPVITVFDADNFFNLSRTIDAGLFRQKYGRFEDKYSEIVDWINKE